MTVLYSQSSAALPLLGVRMSQLPFISLPTHSLALSSLLTPSLFVFTSIGSRPLCSNALAFLSACIIYVATVWDPVGVRGHIKAFLKAQSFSRPLYIIQ